MSEEYSFRVVRSNSNNFDKISDKELTIEVRYILGSAVNLFLKLRISDHLTVNSVSIIGSSNDYLAGYFGLKSASEIESALRDLVLKINDKSQDYTFLSVKWERFSEFFRRWFNTKLTPILQKEFEVSRLLFEEL